MYIRNVTMWVKTDAVHTMANVYSQSILPALHGTDGCLFAALVQNVRNHQMCSSITIWRSRGKAAAYEESGLYERLLGSLRHLFQDTSDVQEGTWDDLQLDYAPTPERPVVTGFEEPDAGGGHLPALPYFVHLLCMDSRSDKIGAFREQYVRNIQSLISPRQGFIDAFLMHRLDRHHSFCLLSFWDGSTEPSAILDPALISSIRDRAGDVLVPEGETFSSVVFRCLTAQWFTPVEQKKPVV